MLMQESSPEMVKAWKAIYEEYRNRLSPNKKTGLEVVTYLTQKYSVTELNEDTKKQVVVDNIILNECHATKLPEGKGPTPKIFLIENTGEGIHLYENQDEVFTGIKIIVGVDLETAYFMVEGSSLLWDELFAFRGLDKDDLNNFYLVAEYIACVQKFGMLENVVVR
jgi:hypothetical protein